MRIERAPTINLRRMSSAQSDVIFKAVISMREAVDVACAAAADIKTA